MPNNINWNLASQQFSEGFNSTFQQGRDLVQRESEFVRTQNFQDRQLRLFEGFRRDELTETAKYHGMLGDYYQGQIEQGVADAKLRKQEGEVAMMNQGWIPTDPSVPSDSNVRTYDAYDKSWIAPVAPPEEIAKMVPGAYGTSMEAKGHYDDKGNWITTNYENVIYPPTPTTSSSGSDKRTDISNETGQVNKLLEIYKGFSKDRDAVEVNKPDGTTAKWDKTLWRANAKQYTTDMLSKVGIDPEGDYLNQIRVNAGVPVYGKNQWSSFSDEEQRGIAENKEKALLDEIYNRRNAGEINDQQYEALRYWAKVGSR